MDYNQNVLEDFSQDNKLPAFLNVLTILTFIGSGLGILGAFALPLSCKMLDKMGDMAGISEKQLEATTNMCANINFVIISTIIGSLFCIFGAFQMRKRKKIGLILYLVGTFLPLILNIIMNGVSSVSYDSKTLVLTLIGALLFPILYAMQLKELNK